MSRILLKISGELFAETELLPQMVSEIKALHDEGVQIALVIGGGNIWRYRDRQEFQLERVGSDTLGMIATLFNARFFAELLLSKGIPAVAMAPHVTGYLSELYVPKDAVAHLEEGRIVVCGGGTGNPYFTTDTTAALRALELSCDVLLKGTKVDGVYDKDPMREASAEFFPEISYDEVIRRDLKILDQTAVLLCRDAKLALRVFNVRKTGHIQSAGRGDSIGTLIH